MLIPYDSVKTAIRLCIPLHVITIQTLRNQNGMILTIYLSTIVWLGLKRVKIFPNMNKLASLRIYS